MSPNSSRLEDNLEKETLHFKDRRGKRHREFDDIVTANDDIDLVSAATEAESSTIAARYGRAPSKRRRDRLVYIVGGAIAALVVIAWVVWAGLDQSGGTIGAEDRGSTIVSDRTVSVSYQVSMPVGSTANCALQVQNETHAIVGWRIVTVPASARYTNSYTDTVKSSERGVTGLIYRCWLT